jgi:hypothetical protein
LAESETPAIRAQVIGRGGIIGIGIGIGIRVSVSLGRKRSNSDAGSEDSRRNDGIDCGGESSRLHAAARRCDVAVPSARRRNWRVGRTPILDAERPAGGVGRDQSSCRATI